MQHFLICRDGHRLGGVENPLDISWDHFTLPNRNDSVGVHRTDMTACNPHINRVNLAARHELGLFHRSLNGING